TRPWEPPRRPRSPVPPPRTRARERRALHREAPRRPRRSPRPATRSWPRQEADVQPGDQLGQDGPIEVAVTTFAGCLRGEQTRVASSPVQRDPLVVGCVLGAERVGRAQTGIAERPAEMPPELLRLAERDKPTERALRVGRS